MTTSPISRPIPINPDPVFRILPMPEVPANGNGGIVPPWLRSVTAISTAYIGVGLLPR